MTARLPPLAADVQALADLPDVNLVVENGACADHPHPHWWFPSRGVTPTDAIAVCSTCSLRLPCLKFGVDNQRLPGVWGGRSRNERRQIDIALRAAST